jgi:hypothetical protein
MKTDLISNFFGGAVIGMIALAMDYFLFQHFVMTPISMSGGFTIRVLLVYLLVPFLILVTSGGKTA